MGRLLVLWLAVALPPFAAELRFSIRGEPKTLDPYLVTDDASELVRYLTSGPLVRVNRVTQKTEPELAQSWRQSADGRRIEFTLRQGVRFSDGRPFTAEDAAFSLRRLVDPALHSPLADSFRPSAGAVEVKALSRNRVALVFPAPVADLVRRFDQVAMLPSGYPQRTAGLGPFLLAEHRPGSHVLLRRNTYYWKRDSDGRTLPYLDFVRLDVQQNREMELTRFRRGQYHLINSLEADVFERLGPGHGAVDVGPGLDFEQLWFNQAPSAPLPDYKKAWFRSAAFRRAVSESINRDDLCRVAYRGRAVPAAGPVSPANLAWCNRRLTPHPYAPRAALDRLQKDGFRLENGRLLDPGGRAVEFSLITNAGNMARERMAALIQQDLSRIGVRLNVAPLDFASLLERIGRTLDYEACLLGMANVEPDPNSQMNAWLSSSSMHCWNPRQKAPATAWEAEIDTLMKAQASTPEGAKRRESFDRVQELAWAEAPVLYLVHKRILVALSSRLRNAQPSILFPQTLWNVERLYLE